MLSNSTIKQDKARIEKVVYVLGAGFSAPLGLPVMSNFLEMSRNMWEEDKEKYGYFEEVFKNIREKIAYISHFYKTNINNIEEILSILEMERLVSSVNEEETKEYIRFLVDVINHYTPRVNGLSLFKWNDQKILKHIDSVPLYSRQVRDQLIDNPHYKLYGDFVLNLLNSDILPSGIEIDPPRNNSMFDQFSLNAKTKENVIASYGIVTLNYDLVLENFVSYYSSIVQGNGLSFIRPGNHDNKGTTYLVKLHGSVDTGNIIPPNWNKSITPSIGEEWKMAYRLLASANYIRIIGYSLPETDSYVRYLLKSSIIDSRNLKGIDVLCRDPDESIKDKYDNFITLPEGKYRFLRGETLDYLNFVNTHIENGHNNIFRHYYDKQSI